MEVVASVSRSHPFHFPLRLRHKRSCNISQLSLSQFRACKEPFVGCSTYKQGVLWNSSTLNGASCIPRKHVCVPWYNYLQEFNQPVVHEQAKASRPVAVRSELAGTGIPDSTFMLSDITFGSRVRGIGFYAVTAIAAILLIVLMIAQHPFVLLFDQYRRRAQFSVAKIWASLTVAPFFKIEYERLENLPPPDVPAVYVSNHQSFLDIYTLLTLGRSFKFISKTGIFLFPIIGWAMYMLGVIPLKRMDSRSQMECLKRCMDLLKKGASVFFFPEGTRSKDGKLCAFKRGAFSVAAKVGVPVVPITLIGTGKIMPTGLEGILNPGSVKVIIHKPIEGSDAAVLCNEARNAIAEALQHQG
ncbi:1-acyl-sn-glycerol-3-phosphate acyltransferase BAT [Salix suchowensis]|nr:1-acyl-sn-glycerol-3-phosphate acyltransferase BAT [Salix suchowensis]